MMKKTKSKNSAGFTLIEMLIVALILSILVAAIIGVFVSVVRVQRYTLATQLLLDQTSYNMEYMSRYLRMAKKEQDENCVSDCPEGISGSNYCYYDLEKEEPGIKFLDGNRKCRAFARKNSSENMLKESVEGSDWLPLFSDDFRIDSFNIKVAGDGEDKLQPRVTFLLDIEADAGGFTPNMKIQTTVSQRDLDK